MKRLRAVVIGRVQGVGYRMSVHKSIEQLDVTGYVKNLPGSTVEIVAEGAQEALIEVLDIARAGSYWSNVENVETEYTDATGEFDGFSIASDLILKLSCK